MPNIFNKKPNLIYLDYNSSTPIHEETLKAMLPFYNSWFYNPSARYAKQIKEYILEIKRDILNILKAKNGRIVFYGGGTDAISSTLQGLAYESLYNANASLLKNTFKGHIISSPTEHDASIETYKHLSKLGFKITLVNVDENGVVNPQDIKDAITSDTLAISIMHVNNETGVLQPIKEISKIARNAGITFHVDGIAAIGKTDIDVTIADIYTMTAHKFYGPKGVALNYIADNIKIQPSTFGSKQEYGLRAGTENVAGMVGLYHSLKYTIENQHFYIPKELLLLEKFQNLLFKKVEDFKINSLGALRVCNTLNISLKGLMSKDLVQNLFDNGVGVASGAASIEDSYSHVIKAMNVDQEYALGTVRFSIGKYTTENEIIQVVDILENIVKDLRR